MYRHLVRTIRTSYPRYLTQPFEGGELYQNILPYRLHRRELGAETNQHYKQAPGDHARRAPKPFKVAEGGEDCTYCKGPLPGGREISFCPHCGQDLTLVHCPACGSELERGWKFCVTCGRASTET